MITYQPDLDSFYKANHQELLACFQSLGVTDRNELHDMSQTFYVQLPDIIRLYDPAKQVKFSTYIFQCVKNLICAVRCSRHASHVYIQYNDDIADRDLLAGISLRLEDFKLFCRRTGSLATEQVISEVQSMMQDHRGFTGVNYCTYTEYRDRFLAAERL
jgi:hypothetical protein